MESYLSKCLNERCTTKALRVAGEAGCSLIVIGIQKWLVFRASIPLNDPKLDRWHRTYGSFKAGYTDYYRIHESSFGVGMKRLEARRQWKGEGLRKEQLKTVSKERNALLGKEHAAVNKSGPI